ncbi:MAG: hypothetical protein R3F38_05045 [Gammaproteobacteria bacterium]
MLRAKLEAALIHGSISLAVSALTALAVFGVWYPGPLAEMTHGVGLFLLVLGVEVVLGPVMTLVIFNTSKPRSELVRDYCVVGTIQLAALAYGIFSVAISRPVFLVFVKDRIEVVAATELSSSDLATAADGFGSLPWFGPRQICVEPPVDPTEKSDLILSAFKGKDIQLQPRYYRECRAGEIAGRMYTKEQLASLTGIKLDALPADFADEPFTWLPVVTRFGAWTVLFKHGRLEDPVYLDIDPFQRDQGKDATPNVTPPASIDR